MSRTTTDPRLTRAAEYVDAVELPDGRWAHYADETQQWYAVSAETLAELADYLDRDPLDGYSFWCAETDSEEMPAGWDPEAHEWHIYYTITCRDPHDTETAQRRVRREDGTVGYGAPMRFRTAAEAEDVAAGMVGWDDVEVEEMTA